MIVSRSRKFVFVHLHKTAGTSIKAALMPHLSSNDVVVGMEASVHQNSNSPNCPLRQLNKHSSAERICQEMGADTWDDYYKFSFVRHPLDRLVSLYEFLNRVKRNHEASQGLLSRLTSFILPNSKKDSTQAPWSWNSMKALTSTTNFSQFIRSEYLEHAQDAKPQSTLLSNQDGKLMVDFVGKFENLTDDWRKVCDQLHVPGTLTHENQSKRRFNNLKDYWTDLDLRFAIEKYHQDFQMFGYDPYRLE